MTDPGFAAVASSDVRDPGVGWALTSDGQIRRATSFADKARRLLRPLFGPVAAEPYRGAADRAWLRKVVDAAPVICADRARLLLSPMTGAGELSELSVSAAVEATNPEYVRVVVRAVGGDGRAFELSEFARIP